MACFLALGDGHELADEINYGDDQRAKRDGAETVGHGAAEGASCGAGRNGGVTGCLAGAEEPGAVDAGDGGVDCVFEPFRNPVGGEGDEDDETDDASIGAGVVIRAGS